MVPAMRGEAGTTIARLRGGLDRSFFPSYVPAERISPLEGTLLIAAFLALASILELFRPGASNAVNSIWAEDGPVFLLGAQLHGFFTDLTSTYAGYLVVVPRLIGEFGDAVPLRQASAAIAVASAFTIALSGLVVWFAAAAHIRSPPLRALLVALTVLSPVAGLEAVDSGAYVTWYMTFAAFWVLLWRPATTWGAGLAGLFVLATGLSGPGFFFFLPIAVLRAVTFRDRRDALILGGFFIALAIQVPIAVTTDENAITAIWTSDIWTAYLQRVVLETVLGEALGGKAWENWGWVCLIIVGVGVAGALLAAAARSSRGRLVAALTVATSLVMFVVSAYERAVATGMTWTAGFSSGQGGRYAIIPSLLLISALLILIDDRTRAPWKLRRSWPAGVAALLFLASLVSSFPVGQSEIRGVPSWQDALATGARECRGGGRREAPIATAPPGWAVPISCARLESEIAAPRGR